MYPGLGTHAAVFFFAGLFFCLQATVCTGATTHVDMFSFLQAVGKAAPGPTPARAVSNAGALLADVVQDDPQGPPRFTSWLQLCDLCQYFFGGFESLQRFVRGNKPHWPPAFECECDGNCAIRMMVEHPEFLTELREERFQILCQRLPATERKRWVDKKRETVLNEEFETRGISKADVGLYGGVQGLNWEK
jgi:hypothetical protein